MRRTALAIVVCGLSLPAPAPAGDREDDPAPRYGLSDTRIALGRNAASFELREARVEIDGNPAGYALSVVRIDNGAATCGPRPDPVHYSGFEAGE